MINNYVYSDIDSLDTHLFGMYNKTYAERDKEYIQHAYTVSKFSPDPSTKNGAIIVHRNTDFIIGRSCNELPNNIKETDSRLNNRDIKYKMIIHAEHGAILGCAKLGFRTERATMYVPFYACNECAKSIINAGIQRVVGHYELMNIGMNHPNWRDSIHLGFQMMNEAGIQCDMYKGFLNKKVLINGKYYTI